MDVLNTEQSALIDEGVFTFDELTATPFAAIAALMAKYAPYDHADFTGRLQAALEKADVTRITRGTADSGFNQESAEVRGLLPPATQWADGVIAQFKLLAHRDAERARKAALLAPAPPPDPDAPPDAAHYLGVLLGDGERGDSYRDVKDRLTGILATLGTIPDLGRFGIGPAEFAEGSAHRTALIAARRQAVYARTERITLTDTLRHALDDLKGLMTELRLIRERVALRVGQELPGYDLTLIRGAAAPLPRPAAEAAQVASNGAAADLAETGM